MALSRHGRNTSVYRRFQRPNLFGDPPDDPTLPNFTPTLSRQARRDVFGAGGDGEAGEGPPRFPQLSTPEMTRERPELNEARQRRLRRLTYGSAIAAGLGALADSPAAAKVAAGLASGFQEGQAAGRQRHQEELSAYYDELADVRAARRQAQNQRALGQYEQELAEYQAQQEAEREAEEAEQAFERKKQLATHREDVQTEAEAERLRQEREIERGDPTYAEQTARINARARTEEEEPDLSGYSLNDVNAEIETLQKALREGYPSKDRYGDTVTQQLTPQEQSEVRDRVRELRSVRQRLLDRQSGGQSDAGSGQGRASTTGVERNVVRGWVQAAQQADPAQVLQQLRQAIQRGDVTRRTANAILDQLGL